MPDLTEITPQKVSDTIDAFVIVTAPEREGPAFITSHLTEADARAFLSNMQSDYNRFATIARVKIPRAMLDERWKRADA